MPKGKLAGKDTKVASEEDVTFTDFERSGVIYTDAEGNPVSKEKMYQEDEMPDAPVESILEQETIEYIGGKKVGGMSQKMKSMNDQFFDAIDRTRAKNIFDTRQRIKESFKRQELEGLRERGVKQLPRLGSPDAEKRFGRVRTVTSDDIEEAKYRKERIRKDDEALEKAGFVNTISLKEGGMSCPHRRKGAKSGIQGVKDIQLKGGKFIGCK